MKKLLLSLSVLLMLGLPELSAQLINADFETWTSDQLVQSAYDPNAGIGSTGWWDLNPLNSALLGGSPVTVFRDSAQPYQGKYCAKIVSQTMTATSYSTIKKYDPSFNFPQTNGLIFTATITQSFKVTTGIPVTSSWPSFSFYYKYYPNGSDTCSCTIAMYHWNSVTKKSDLIGGGIWKSGVGNSAWTSATVNIAYDSSSVADTAVIVFSAASLYSNPKVNDSMMIDQANYVASIGNINAPHDNVNLYPNPAQTEVNLVVSGQYQANRVEVYDITGKLVGIYSMNNNSLTINTQSYTSGIYLYKLLDNTGVQLNIGKFSVVK